MALLIDGMKIARKDKAGRAPEAGDLNCRAKTQKNLGVFASLREAKNNSYLNSATPEKLTKWQLF